MNLFLLSLKVNGYPIDKATELLSEIHLMNNEAFLEWHEQKKWDVFNYHYNTNKFYRSLVMSRSDTFPDRWSGIPIITKNDFQNPVKDIIAEGIGKNEIYLSNTSGSSGHPFYFAKDKFCHAVTWAIAGERYKWHNIDYGKSLQARFYGIPLARKGYLREKIKDGFSARVRFPIFDLSVNNLNGFLQQFRKYKFEYINGYTSSLCQFAAFLIDKDIVLKDICRSLKVAIPTAEVLNEKDRNLLKKAFGVPIINEYGASEVGIIAFENKDSDWIISNEQLYIEIVDEKGKQVDQGKTGRIIITDLFNKAMPFIRYEIGDIGSLSTGKEGNKDVLSSLQGRTNDFALLPSGRRSPGLTFYYISKSLLEGGTNIREFTIKQLEPALFHFEYVADKMLEELQKQQIQTAMDLYLEPGLKATFERKERIERTAAGKLKQFQYLVEYK